MAAPLPFVNAHASVSQGVSVLPDGRDSSTQWFVTDVLPHETALRAYLRVRFPSLTDIDNIVQETFARMIRTYQAGTVRAPKALLFTTARHAALDLLRREQRVAIEACANLDALGAIEETPAAFDTLTRDQELQLLEQAVQSLPKRCQQILIMKKIDGLSYAEIGARLGIKPNTISAQLTLGVLRCRRFLAVRGYLKGRRHE